MADRHVLDINGALAFHEVVGASHLSSKPTDVRCAKVVGDFAHDGEADGEGKRRTNRNTRRTRTSSITTCPVSWLRCVRVVSAEIRT